MSDSDEGGDAGTRTNKERSPNYPSIPLTQAVEMAGKWYEREKRTNISPEAAAKALGYGALSGSARTAIGSLRQYGLVENAKDGLRISDLAMEIIHQPIGSPERTKALKQAAMRPPLIAELSSSHGDASDDSFRAYLITRRKFSPDGAGRFVPAFREALQIARLPDLAGGSATEPDVAWHREFKYQAPQPERLVMGLPPLMAAPAPSKKDDGGETMNFVWTLSGDVVATMTVSKLIEPDDVEVLVDNIEAAKKAIRKQANANAAKNLPPQGGSDGGI